MPRSSLLGASRSRVLQSILSESKTAGEVATQLHITLTAARKHLERLGSLGFVEGKFEAEGVGRPKKRYQLTTEGKELFPRQYDQVLNRLLTKISEDDGGDRAESIMAALAKDIATDLDGTSTRSAVHSRKVEDGVNLLGFESTFKRNNGTLTVISRNCPLWKVALSQRETVCRGFHEELLHNCFGSKKIEREKWMIDGDSYCKHTIIAKDLE